MEDISYIIDTVPSLEGWCTVEKALKLYDLVNEIDSPLCVELGVFGGRSLMPIALAAKAKGGSVVGIDAWAADASKDGDNDIKNDEWWGKIDYDHFYKYTQTVISNAKCEKITKLVRKKSLDCVKDFADQSIDVLHQDSNHSELVSTSEVIAWCNKVKINGYWIFDDTDWPSTQYAQSLLLNKGYVEIFTEKDSKYKIYTRVS